MVILPSRKRRLNRLRKPVCLTSPKRRRRAISNRIQVLYLQNKRQSVSQQHPLLLRRPLLLPPIRSSRRRFGPKEMKDLFVADLAKFENQTVTGFFAVTVKQVRSKKDGALYFALTLSDCTGQIECRMWEVAEAQAFESGDVVKARGQVSRYQDRPQLTLDRIRRANPEEYDLGDFVPRTSRDIEELWAELNGYVSSFTNPYLQGLLRAFLDDPLIS